MQAVVVRTCCTGAGRCCYNLLHRCGPLLLELVALVQAEEEMRAMRSQMLRLVPHDPNDTKLDVQHAEIQPRGHAIVEEKGETKLKLEFDVHQFKPEEVKVKVLGANILQVGRVLVLALHY